MKRRTQSELLCPHIFDLSWRVLLAVLVSTCCLTTASVLNGQSETGEFMRPWESRPYEVMVWLCSNQSPEIAAVSAGISRDLMRRAELADPSAWNVRVESAPAGWRDALLNHVSDPAGLTGLESAPELDGFDKMIAVCLTQRIGNLHYLVREFDVQTGQWGVVVQSDSTAGSDLARELFVAVERVFMPLARIDRVQNDDNILLRARAVNACLQADILEGSNSPIENSPVWIRPEDRFLPIIRLIDRNGNLDKLQPIAFTFLTIESQEGPRINCKAHSRQRLPLGGRSSKRAQKLALVIRPAESSTSLKLISQDNSQRELSGYEVYSRPPGSKSDQDSEFIGMTDWQGAIDIPPTSDGLRLLYVKRGSRPLLKIPVIPGLYEELVSTVPDDESRLAAEGIAQGFQIEILNLVAQRELFQSQIQTALKRGQLDQAKSLFQQFQNLESPQNLKLRLVNEEIRLRDSTSNKQELEYIRSMFGQLTTLVNNNLAGAVESELQAAIQQRQTGNQ